MGEERWIPWERTFRISTPERSQKPYHTATEALVLWGTLRKGRIQVVAAPASARFLVYVGVEHWFPPYLTYPQAIEVLPPDLTKQARQKELEKRSKAITTLAQRRQIGLSAKELLDLPPFEKRDYCIQCQVIVPKSDLFDVTLRIQGEILESEGKTVDEFQGLTLRCPCGATQPASRQTLFHNIGNAHLFAFQCNVCEKFMNANEQLGICAHGKVECPKCPKGATQ